MAEDDGVFVGSGGFRVDRRKALETLAGFQLRTEDLLVPWVRLAAASHAEELAFSLTGRSLTADFDGAPLSRAELADPFAGFFDAGAPRRLAYLAAGLLGLARLKPARFSLESGAGRARFRLEGANVEESSVVGTPGDGRTVLGVDLSEAGAAKAASAMGALGARLLECPVRVCVAGVPLTSPPLPGEEFKAGGLRGRLAAADPAGEMSRVRLCVDGAAAQTVEHKTPWGPVDAVLAADSLPLDMSQAAVVQGDALRGALEALDLQVGEFLLRETDRQRDAAPRLRKILLDPRDRGLWAQAEKGRGGLLGGVAGMLGGFLGPPGEDAAFVRRAVSRIRWLKSAARGRLLDFGKDMKDARLRELWTVPLYLNAADGWLSWRDIAEIRARLGSVYVSHRPGRAFPIVVPRQDGHLESVTVAGTDTLWALSFDEVRELYARFGEGAVSVID